MKRGLVTVILVALFSLAVVWAPFALHLTNFWGIDFDGHNMQTVVANYDGINFLVVAKSWYNTNIITSQFSEFLTWRQPLYYSAHYPLFPAVIWLFNLGVNGPNAILSSVVLSNLLLSTALYYFFYTLTKSSKQAVILSLVGLFFPARMLAVRSVGSNEPLFMAMILLSIASAYKNKNWQAGIYGALAVLTRSPGILLFVAYGLVGLAKYKTNLKALTSYLLPYLLIPLALFALWSFYGIAFGSFWTYFKVGGNINLYLPPFMVFASHMDWVSGMWLEDIIYIYLVFSLGIASLFTKTKTMGLNKVIYYFPVIYLTTVFFIAHRDIARYSLPIAPFVILGFADLLKKKYVRYIMIILMVPIFLWTYQFLLQNAQPISDWTPLL